MSGHTGAAKLATNIRSIHRFKKELMDQRDLKQAHCCEAMARGLGFKTYATLLHKLAHGGDVAVVVDPQKFEDFFLERGYPQPPGDLYDYFQVCAADYTHEIARGDA